MKRKINNLFSSKILLFGIGLVVIALVIGVGAIAYEGVTNVYNIENAVFNMGSGSVGDVIDDEEVLGGEIYNRKISFDEGIAVDGTIVIDGNGAITIPTGQNFTITSGDLTLTAGDITATAGDFTMSDGVIDLINVGAVLASATPADLLTLTSGTLHSTGGDDGAGAGIVLKIENSSTTPADIAAIRLLATFDDATEGSEEVSFGIFGITDSTPGTWVEWLNFDSGAITAPFTLTVTGSSTFADISASDGVFTDGVTVATTLGVTGATTLGSTVDITGNVTNLGSVSLGTTTAQAFDFYVADDNTATTTIQFGNGGNSACVTWIISGTTYYFDPTASQADDYVTSTAPGYCS